MPEQEQAVLNPAEFMPESVEVPLSDLGLGLGERAEGIDWGEATIQAQMFPEDEGETSSDGHRPGVPIRIPIRVHEDGEVSLAEAAHTLQSVVGRWQDEGGWIRRDFADAGGFSGSLAYRIYRHTAQVSGMQGWLWAHRLDAPDVVLTAVRHPIGYALVEVEGEEFTEEERRALQFKIAHIAGTAPGLIAILVTNKGEVDLRGLIFAAESRDHPQDATAETTAALEYMAADLTLKGAAKDIGGGVVEHDALSAGWLTIVNSKIDGVGHMTHRGVRRPLLYAEQVGGEVGDVQLKARWRPLGQIGWEEENEVVSFSVVDADRLLDMGECRTELPALGDPRWELEIMGRAPGGAGKVRLKEFFPLPTEMFAVARTRLAAPAADLQQQKSAGKGAGSGEGQEWAGPENVKLVDSSRAVATLESPGSGEDKSEILTANQFGFSLPEDARLLDIVIEIMRRQSGGIQTFMYVRDQLIQLVLGEEVLSPNLAKSDGWPTSDAYASYSFDARGLTATQVNSSSFAVQLVAERGGKSGSTMNAEVNHVRLTPYYTEAADENSVCFAGRAMEIGTAGIYRQHREDDVWGRLTEEGFLPSAPPSGLEGREFRGIIIPTQGDLESLSDSGSNPLSAKPRVRGGYHFATEAAS